MGATVSASLGEGITHYVCSNGSKARIAASIVLGIKIVRPSWIEKCKKVGKKVDESGHSIISGVSASDAAAAVLAMSNGSSSSSVNYYKNGCSRARRNDSFYSVDSSSMNSTADQKDDAEQQGQNRSARERSGGRTMAPHSEERDRLSSTKSCRSTAFGKSTPSSTSFNEQLSGEGTGNLSDTDDYGRIQFYSDSPNRSSRNTINNNNNSSSSSISKNRLFIPLPSYKEYSSGVLPITFKKQRRSERICDNVEEVSFSCRTVFFLEDLAYSA